MKKDFTAINVVLDRSGSMERLRLDTIGGFNQFLADQKALPGEAVFTLCLFNNDYHLPHSFEPIANVEPLNDKTYVPAGGTSLLDALGISIDEVGKRLDLMSEDEKPEHVLFLVITDGQENTSKLFTKDQILEKITHQREKYNWEFVYMGADADAIEDGKSLGISAKNSVNYDASASGTADLYKSISSNTSSHRTFGVAPAGFFVQPIIISSIK